MKVLKFLVLNFIANSHDYFNSISAQEEPRLLLSSLRESIELKPTIKKRGRPKFSSKLWPSKQKKKKQIATLNKENIERTQVQVLLIVLL